MPETKNALDYQGIEARLLAVVTPEYIRLRRYGLWLLVVLSAGGQIRAWSPLAPEDYALVALTYIPAIAILELHLRRLTPASSGHYSMGQLELAVSTARPCPGCGVGVLGVEPACTTCGSRSPHGRVSPTLFWGVVSTVVLVLVVVATRARAGS